MMEVGLFYSKPCHRFHNLEAGSGFIILGGGGGSLRGVVLPFSAASLRNLDL
jgi:hypothetical protein